MKKRCVIVLMILVSAICRADYVTDVSDYVQKYKGAALAAESKWDIPAPLMLAMAILESNCGKSAIARKANNHFGIKGRGPAGSVKAKDDEPGLSPFRAYKRVEESYNDIAKLLTSKQYSKLKNYSRWNYRAWAHGVNKCGYSVVPDYAESLIGIIERFELYKINGGEKIVSAQSRIASDTN